MPPRHPCLDHIDHCSAVIGAGGDTAERLRREVERADALHLQGAVARQAGECTTLGALVQQNALPPGGPLMGAITTWQPGYARGLVLEVAVKSYQSQKGESHDTPSIER